ASQNSRKHIRSPIDHVGVAVAALGDQADVFWNGRMCGTGPLAIDHFVKVVGCRDISRFHSYLVRAVTTGRAAFNFCCERSSRRSCGSPAIMDLVNQPIQYDRSCSEKPFLPNGHSPLVWPP